MPKRVKYRKSQRGRIKGKASRGNTVAFGEYGLQCLERAWLSGRQIEAGRIAAQHYLGRDGKLWVRVFPHKSVSQKPLETRMGTGKGEVAFWVAVVKPGTMVYEIGGASEDLAREALRRSAHKLPVHSRFASRGVAL
jgi:large subunit ribosomal protein L16